MKAAAAVFVVLLAARAAGFRRFALGDGRFDGESARVVLVWGLWPLALAAGAWLVALGLGRRALAALGPKPDGALDEISAAALGLGLLGQGAFFLGWAGFLTPPALAVFALCAAGAALGAGLGPRRVPDRPRFARLGSAAGAAAGLLAFAAFCAVLRALAPATDWDVRAYHLAIPELYLRTGRTQALPWLIHSHWPHLMETLYVLPLAVGRDGAAAALHLGAAALLASGVALAARRCAGPTAAWAAALLLVGQPDFLAEAGLAHADIALTLLAFAAAWQLSRWDEKGGGRRGRVAAAGLLAGAAAACKMTGLAVVAGGAAYLLWRRRPKSAALYAAAALAFVGPWLAKTWLETGDPFWPFFSGAADASALAARYLVSNRWSGAPPAWLFQHDGPLFLLLPVAALAALVPRPNARASAIEKVLWFSVPFFLVGTWRHHEAWRFLMPAWACLVLAAARRAASAFERGGAWAATAGVLLLLGAAPIAGLAPNNALFAVLAPRPALSADTDRRALFEDRSVDVASFYRESRALLPAGAKVLLFREIRGYRAGFDYVWGDPKNQALIDYASLPNPAALCARLKALGVTHVLDHPSSALYREDPAYYDARTLALMRDGLRLCARPVLSRNGLALHQLL